MKKLNACFVLVLITMVSCNNDQAKESTQNGFPIQGTWQLISGTLIEKNDTTVTDYTKDKSFIKIINDTHFAFIAHDLDKGKDSATAFFSCGGGAYNLHDSSYTEHLEYCDAREWEGNSFQFTISINNDTLVQRGLEKIDSINVNRINIEKYVRLKDSTGHM